VTAGSVLIASPNTVVLADITGATPSDVVMPPAPANNDEVTVVFTNWDFVTGAGPTSSPGPAPDAGTDIVANAGQQVANPMDDGVYTSVGGSFNVNVYAVVKWKYRAANQTWYIVA
jgi:hypothetical protein